MGSFGFRRILVLVFWISLLLLAARDWIHTCFSKQNEDASGLTLNTQLMAWEPGHSRVSPECKDQKDQNSDVQGQKRGVPAPEERSFAPSSLQSPLPPHKWQPLTLRADLSHPVHSLVSLWHALTALLKMMLYQLSRHPSTQASWHLKLATTHVKAPSMAMSFGIDR